MDKIILPSQAVEGYLSSIKSANLTQQVRGNTKSILEWKVGDNIAYNSKLYKIMGLYDNSYGHAHKIHEKGKISAVIGIGHRGRHESIGGSLGIEDRIFIPSNHTSFCSFLVRPLVNELTNPTERGGSLVRYEKLMEFWVSMCKNGNNPDLLKQIITEMESWAKSEHRPIVEIRRKKVNLFHIEIRYNFIKNILLFRKNNYTLFKNLEPKK